MGWLHGDRELREVLEACETIAVVGLSPRGGRPSHFVSAYLQRVGYRIVPVNPGHAELLGERCYPSLAAVPADVRIDIVDVFRQPAHIPGVVAAVIARGSASTLWLQPGCEHAASERLAVGAGLNVVTHLCLKTEHRRLIGGGRRSE